jgi:hypothetical protein
VGVGGEQGLVLSSACEWLEIIVAGVALSGAPRYIKVDVRLFIQSTGEMDP